MDELVLIRDALQGDLNAFNTLILAHQAIAYNLAYRILGESAPAEDATQEAFLSAFRHLRSYRGGSFRAWVLRIVTNASYDELRRRKRRPALSLEGMGDDEDGPDDAGEFLAPSGEEGPEQAAERSELARALTNCLQNLPTEFRTVAVLVDVQGFDYAEAAAVVNKPVGTVKSRLARARARLRDCLDDHRELLPSRLRLESGTGP
ncbi:MAG: RNA polymerase sigma factor [Anaerolineales bacterium]